MKIIKKLLTIIKKLLTILIGERMFLKNIFYMIIITRLLFLESNQLALIAEIITSIAFVFATDDIKFENDEKTAKHRIYEDHEDDE